MREQIADAALGLTVLIDDELSAERPAQLGKSVGYPSAIGRIESDPRGALTMSCNAVGTDAHAFSFDKTTRRIQRATGNRDEVLLGIPQVVYQRG
jgi:hypothetical protein